MPQISIATPEITTTQFPYICRNSFKKFKQLYVSISK